MNLESQPLRQQDCTLWDRAIGLQDPTALLEMLNSKNVRELEAYASALDVVNFPLRHALYRIVGELEGHNTLHPNATILETMQSIDMEEARILYEQLMRMTEEKPSPIYN